MSKEQIDILEDESQPTVKEKLYVEYSLPFESYENFCDRMYDAYGDGWEYLFSRKSMDK